MTLLVGSVSETPARASSPCSISLYLRPRCLPPERWYDQARLGPHGAARAAACAPWPRARAHSADIYKIRLYFKRYICVPKYSFGSQPARCASYLLIELKRGDKFRFFSRPTREFVHDLFRAETRVSQAPFGGRKLQWLAMVSMVRCVVSVFYITRTCGAAGARGARPPPSSPKAATCASFAPPNAPAHRPSHAPRFSQRSCPPSSPARLHSAARPRATPAAEPAVLRAALL
jgi:hypothetical protein